MHGFAPADVDAVCEEARLLSFARVALATAPPIALEAASCAAAMGGGGVGGSGGRRAACEPTEAEWWEAVRSVQPSGLLGLIEAPADAATAPPPPPPPPPLGSLGPPAGVEDGGAGGDGWNAVGGLEGVKRRLRLLLQAPLAAAPLCAQHDQSGLTRITAATPRPRGGLSGLRSAA